MAQRVNSEEFHDVLASPVLLADFYSDSCVPCKRLSPVLAELEEEHTDIKFVKVNVAYEEDLVEKYEVQASPTLILFRNGEETGRLRGAVKKEELEEFLKAN